MMQGGDSVASARKVRDERGLTAVVEFLSAFVLFLVIVSAFLALSQLKLGSNVADVDRLDQMAIDGLERLTDSKGHVVLRNAGIRDIANATDDWQLYNASTLLTADLLPAIGDGAGHLDMSRIGALGNVTEDRLIHGLGIDEGLSLNLTIIVVQSSDESQIGEIIFSDGSSRSSATRGATASRIMHLDDEMVRVTLEVHNAGREPSGLRITEFMADPLNGPPEWIELENPDGFAMNMSGWSLARPGAFELIQDGALAAGERVICTGNAVTQYNPNNAMMIDMAASGVLGTGTIDALAVEGDTITLGWTRAGTVLTYDVIVVTWDDTWDIQANHSMTYNLGGSPSSSTNWTGVDGGTPGW
ncbi:MAG TPA: lamin tail domain-containing protein [Candidatus Thalassarchaeaceae archaeon]|nr:lamin tail domain-containing protein [Candidatus Thalassarchaeaceae archaeon]